MEYILLLIALYLIMLFYFKVADKYNIIDKPNHRSAHTEITLRGGGIIFWFSALIYFVQQVHNSYLFFVGITVVSVISFWDDIQSLPNKVRITAHFIAISLLFYALNLFQAVPLWGIIIGYIIAIGIINAYNFMDGINGITGLYTIIILFSIVYVNSNIINFTTQNLIIYPILASVVFLFFNFRKKAKCFAGDVGSIAIAFWIIYLLLQLILKTNSFIWFLFLGVYGVDSIMTIIHRLYLKQNIFEAHRLHFYQVLSNDYKMDHRIVAILYAGIQAIVSIVVIIYFNKLNEGFLFAIILTPLLLLYTLKFYLLKQIKTNVHGA
jgi:UDP-N-acetylmuramyl pentapeptide phosphotransferase/UDP-N-acetylglucosamine-1-phosphate transferase